MKIRCETHYRRRAGKPICIMTDKLSPYGVAPRGLGLDGRKEAGRWLNDRAGNSHLPLRRRERAMQRFRLISRRSAFKDHRAAAPAEWRQLGAA